ncbi:MAG: LptF/LptG family permease [Holosporales bacterium]|nr:LptF/LptG family permease [Holosporales bacterium]
MILHRYIIKNQAKMLLFMTCIISVLVFTTDFIETVRVEIAQQHTVFTILYKSLFKFPYIVLSVYPYIFLGASGIVLWRFIKSNQITIIKTIGFKDISILKPLVAFGFVIGLLWLAVLQPIACKMYLKVMNPELIAKMYAADSKMENIWLHQRTEDAETLIHIDELHSKIATGISIYSLDKTGILCSKIMAKEAFLSDKGFFLHDGISSDSSNESITKFTEKFFKTNISADHFASEFRQSDFMGIYDLIELLILRLDANLGYQKLLTQIHSLLAIVLLTAIMPLFAAVPCMVHSRNYRGIHAFFLLVVGSVFMYFALNVLRMLGLSKTHPHVLLVWIPVLLLGFASLCFISIRERRHAVFS